MITIEATLREAALLIQEYLGTEAEVNRDSLQKVVAFTDTAMNQMELENNPEDYDKYADIEDDFHYAKELINRMDEASREVKAMVIYYEVIRKAHTLAERAAGRSLSKDAVWVESNTTGFRVYFQKPRTEGFFICDEALDITAIDFYAYEQAREALL